MRLVRWNPSAALSFGREFDELFGTVCGNRGNSSGIWQPRVDVTENGSAFVLHAELPGLSREDISVKVKDDVLTIEGEKVRSSEEDDTGAYRSERAYGKFSRSFKLSAKVNAESISAVHKDGVLSLTLPKAEVAKPKEIEVVAA